MPNYSSHLVAIDRDVNSMGNGELAEFASVVERKEYVVDKARGSFQRDQIKRKT